MSKANEPAEAQDDAARGVAHAAGRKPWSTPTVTVSHLRDARAHVSVGSDGTSVISTGFIYQYGS
jgi:hypothetical protein